MAGDAKSANLYCLNFWKHGGEILGYGEGEYNRDKNIEHWQTIWSAYEFSDLVGFIDPTWQAIIWLSVAQARISPIHIADKLKSTTTQVRSELLSHGNTAIIPYFC